MPLLLKIIFSLATLYSLIYNIHFITFEFKNKHTKSAVATLILTALMLIFVPLGIVFF